MLIIGAWNWLKWLFAFTAALAGAFALSGCKGIPTPSEKAARYDLERVSAVYRPGGLPPVLPVLTSNSSLSNFIEFAFLNQPAVSAAYYDWVASVERITQARSFPDPQFAFQMDIQNVVTSVMPGLMGTLPWPGKLRAGADVASADSRAKYYAFQSAILQSAFEVKRTYYQLEFLSEKLRVNQDTLQLLGGLERLARAQNEVGKSTLQDVLRAQIEQQRLRTELANLEDSSNALVAQFKAALGLNASDPGPPIPSKFEPSTLDTDPGNLLNVALSRHQRL